MVNGSTAHEVLAVVFQVRQLSTRNPQLSVLLWERAKEPQRGAWSLPGGPLRHDEDMTSSVRRQLAEKVDLRELAHLEQLAVFSDPHRVPGARTIASTFLGLVPSPATPELPPDTRWHPVNALPPMAFDHGTDGRARAHPSGREDVLHEYRIRLGAKGIRAVDAARHLRRRARLSSRRHQPAAGARHVAASSPRPAPPHDRAAAGAGPAALYRFTESAYRVTDEFAALRPPG